ncbi:hypothetical protein TNIN_452511, partial [Trichonephila inaurata madagascariensis]
MKLYVLLVAILVVGTEAFRKGAWRRPRCEWVRCEENCRKVKDEATGCFKCVCEPLCSPPKCGPGCVIQEKFEGPCPGCDCKEDDEIVDIVEKKVICEPPVCGPGCEIEVDFVGPCPGCVCKKREDFEEPKIVCDPPRCEPGFFILNQFYGPFSGCECPKK